MRILIVFVLWLGLTAQPTMALQTKPVQQQPLEAKRDAACAAAMSQDDVQRLNRDLREMRSLLERMQRNLAATATGETPLKHQFQLQIDMWRLLIRRLEEKTESAKRR